MIDISLIDRVVMATIVRDVMVIIDGRDRSVIGRWYYVHIKERYGLLPHTR